jgi:hypothetical protein
MTAVQCVSSLSLTGPSSTSASFGSDWYVWSSVSSRFVGDCALEDIRNMDSTATQWLRTNRREMLWLPGCGSPDDASKSNPRAAANHILALSIARRRSSAPGNALAPRTFHHRIRLRENIETIPTLTHLLTKRLNVSESTSLSPTPR